MNNPGPSQREVTRIDDARTRDTALTYEPFYRLAQKPFSLAADPQFLFKSETHGPVFEDLLAGIRRREGLVVLTSDIGMGKTTLCRSAVQQLDRKTFSAFVPDPFMSREDLLKTLLMDFGVVSIDELRGGHIRASSRLELSYVLYEFLDSLVPLQAFAVVIIDEAQNLSIPLLEEIRILADLVGREKLLQVVLVGQLELEAKLKLPEMRQVDQRVSTRCSLTPLSSEDVHRYVKHRLSVASTPATTLKFSTEALDEVCRISGGVPRVINLLCDRSLFESYRTRAHEVTAAAVTTAAQRLALAQPVDEVETQTAPVPASNPATAVPALAETTPRPPAVGVVVESAMSDFLSESEIAPDLLIEVDEPVEPETAPWMDAKAIAFLLSVAVVSGTLSWYFLNQLLGATAIAAPAPPMAPPLALARTAPPVLPSLDLILDAESTPSVPLHFAPSTAAGDEGPTFGIQIASFENPDRASRLVELLSNAGIHARVVEWERGTNVPLHQVLADGYPSLQLAEADLQIIQGLRGYEDARVFRAEPAR